MLDALSIYRFPGSATEASAFDLVSAVDLKPVSKFANNERRLARQPLLERITDFQKRAHNWDGDGGEAPNKEAVLDARRFLRQIPNKCPLPDAVYAPGDGEVLFQWRNDARFAEIGFFGDGSVSWCVRPKEGCAVYDDQAIGVSPPKDFIAALV